MRVGLKLLVPQLLQFLLLLLVCGMIVFNLYTEYETLSRSHGRMETRVELAERLKSMRADNVLRVLAYANRRDPAQLHGFARYEEEVSVILTEYAALTTENEERLLLDTVADAQQRITESRTALINAIDSGNAMQQDAAFQRWEIHRRLLDASLNDLAGYALNRLRAAVNRVDAQRAYALTIAAYGALAFVLLIMLGTHFVRRYVSLPLERLTTAIDGIARGDLSLNMQPELAGRRDEFGNIARAFTNMTVRLKDIHSTLEDRVQKRTLQLDASVKELEAFAYSVSHDLRVPLRAIDGFSHMLEQRYREQLDDEARRLIGVVRDNSQKMGRLIDDILAFSRMGRQEITWNTVDMNALAQAAAEELAPHDKGRRFELQIGTLPSAQGNNAMLRQVWINLISNAIKFSSPKAHPKIEIGACRDDQEQVYYVKDNGVGFDMQYASKLFGVFQRLHGVDEFEGTGIGLAIVKRIVSRHGGRVWAEAQLNEGATLYFALPLAGTQGAETPDQYYLKENA